MIDIKIRDLNKRIILKKVIKTKNSFGEYIETYSNFCQCWAKIERDSSYNDNDRMQLSNKLVNRYTKLITIRYINNITDDMIILYNNDYYRILNIDMLEEKRKFIIFRVEKFEN